MSSIIQVKNNELKNIEEGYSVVQFTAKWCGPCRLVAPLVEKYSDEYVNRVKFYKVDIDDNDLLASKYDIDSIPRFLFFKKGEVLDEISGSTAASNIEKHIKELMTK